MMELQSRAKHIEDLAKLQKHIRGCNDVSSDSFVSRIVLSRLEDESIDAAQTIQHETDPQQQGTQNSAANASVRIPSKRRSASEKILSILRFILIDLSLALIFCCFLLCHLAEFTYEHYFIPSMEAAHWSTTNRLQDEFTYYERQCDASDVTTFSMNDMTLSDTSTSTDAVENFMTHGANIYPKLLSDETMSDLRAYILKRNSELTPDENIPLDGPENRISFGVGANEHPSITAALKEIGNNSLLQNSLEELMGPNPALVEITTITAIHGAKNQGWHPDVKPRGNSVKYARTFTHSYALFVPLQDTTQDMGATEICPGTQFCPNNLEHTCTKVGFAVAGNRPDNVWKAGDAMVMNQCLWHRGPAHIDPNGPNRVVFILTFISRPEPGVDNRQLSHGTYFHMRPDMFGFTFNDLKIADIAMRAPFTWLRSLGIWKPPNVQWGWDWLTVTSLRITNFENGYHTHELYSFLDYHGLAKRIPDFLHGTATEEGGWKVYIAETISNFKKAFAISYGLLVLLYLWVAFLIDLCTRFTSRRFTSTVMRTLIFNMVLAALTYKAKDRIEQTPWAKSIMSKTNFQRPFTGRQDDELSEEKYQESSAGLTTIPENADILYNDRFDSKQIGYFENFLDYHPGNRRFKKEISTVAELYNSYSDLPVKFQNLMFERMETHVKNNNSRFLLQNAYGDWTKMEPSEIKKLISKELLKEDDRNELIFALDREVSFLTAGVKQGQLRNKGVIKDTSLKVLSKWRNILEKCLPLSPPNVNVDKTEVQLTKAMHPSLFRLKKVDESKSRNLKVKSVTVSLPPEVEVQWVPSVGETVLLMAQDDSMFPVIVVNIDKLDNIVTEDINGATINIRFEFVVRYFAIEEGDFVDFWTYTCRQCNGEWKRFPGVIVHAYPDQTYDITNIDTGESVLRHESQHILRMQN